MRLSLSLRTTLFFLLVGTAPLGLAGYSALRLADAAQSERLSDLHIAVTHLLAERIADELGRDIQQVRLAAAAFEKRELPDEERAQALGTAFLETDRAGAIAMLDARARLVAPVVHPSSVPSEKGLEAFIGAIPFKEAWESGSAMGTPYASPDDGGMRQVMAARAGGAPYLLAVDFDLSHLTDVIGRTRLGPSGRAFVVDATGRIILDGHERARAEVEDRWSWEPVRRALVGTSQPVRYQDPIIGDALGSGARVPNLGWAVIATEPYEEAHAVTSAMRKRLRNWLLLALLTAAVLGIFFARALVLPIRRLSLGASALAEGDLSHRVPEAGRADELGDLARSFNEMAAEIERWNHEIEARVESQRTSLKEAELLLARSVMRPRGERRLGEIADDIDQPVSAILGMSQVLANQELPGTQTHERLERIQELAARVRAITNELRKLAGVGPDDRVGKA